MGKFAMDVVTLELAFRAKQFGACGGQRVGKKLYELDQSDLIWAHRNDLLTDEEKASLGAPLWALSEDGDGSGSGYGNGYGDGSGNGYGYGFGNGYGYGDDLSEEED